ncbi:hypothetical protein [Streptomyces sp. RK9]|uniref:hypothetical protein n=1 Tax=Streptomyces sp. RK9 TaxID=3239284 RepID=UPI00386AC8AC
MACRYCTGHHSIRLDAYPAGNPRAVLLADHRAVEARTQGPGPVHVHYDAIDDTFVVIRTDALVNHR